MKLSWINENVSTGEHYNLEHNAYYAVDVISRSLRRANALEAIKQAHDAGYITDATHIDALKEILKREGFEIDFVNNISK